LLGAYTGYPCNLLKKYRKEEIEDDELLIAAAKVACLGSGYEFDQLSPMLDNYDLAWRVTL
jgi:hypothetical protein